MFGTNQLTARIARLESQVRAQQETLQAMAKQLGIDPVAVDPMDLDAEEFALIADGRVVEAIKHHRERTGSSLLQSKQAADRARFS